MYEKSRDFEHYWQNRRKCLILEEMRYSIRNGKAKSLLDIGCAEGLFTENAVNFGFEPVVGLEISRVKLRRAISRAQARGMKIDYVLGSAENLPFKNDIFDLTLLSRVLELVPKEEQCLKEDRRVTKSLLILTVPSAHCNLLGLLRTMLKTQRKTFKYPWGTQARSYAGNELVKKLNKNWKVIRFYGIAPFTHLIILLNKNIWRRRIFQKLDSILENKSLFRFLGHDIFLICSKLKA